MPPETTARLLERFLGALAADDQDALLALVSEDATLTSDGGGKVPATRRVVRGPSRIVRLLLGLRRKERGRITHTLEWLNGEPAIVSRSPLGVFCTTSVASDGARLTAFYRVLKHALLEELRSAAADS